MKCPFCGRVETKVIDSRINQTGDITRRRRECVVCDGRFTTYERVEEVMPVIIKKDGRRETYIRDKVLGGVQKACQKRSVTTQVIEGIITKIEKRVQSYGLKEIPSRAIGKMVMIELHDLDKVAYIRFASVYREFQDVDEFVSELREPIAPQEDSSSMAFPFVAEEKPEVLGAQHDQ